MPRGNIKMLYYFCYGVALMDRSLDRQIDSLRLEGQGRLQGQRMTFSRAGGRPNLEPDESASTWGCLYLIEERHLPDLDAQEPGGRRHEGHVLFEGVSEPCVYYSYPPQAGRPDAAFLEAFRGVYGQAGLPQAQIDRALGLPAKVGH